MTSPGKRKHHTPSCGMLISNRNCRVQEEIPAYLPRNRPLVFRAPPAPGLYSHNPACCVAYSLRSHIDLHIRDVHRVCSPMEVLVAVHDFFFLTCWLGGPMTSTLPWRMQRPHMCDLALALAYFHTWIHMRRLGGTGAPWCGRHYATRGPVWGLACSCSFGSSESSSGHF
jgi:hypothetical protein